MFWILQWLRARFMSTVRNGSKHGSCFLSCAHAESKPDKVCWTALWKQPWPEATAPQPQNAPRDWAACKYFLKTITVRIIGRQPPFPLLPPGSENFAPTFSHVWSTPLLPPPEKNLITLPLNSGLDPVTPTLPGNCANLLRIPFLSHFC